MECLISPSTMKRKLASGTWQGVWVQNSVGRYHWPEELQELVGNYNGYRNESVINTGLERLQHARRDVPARGMCLDIPQLQLSRMRRCGNFQDLQSCLLGPRSLAGQIIQVFCVLLDSKWLRSELLLCRQENGWEKGVLGFQGCGFCDVPSVLGDSCRNSFHWLPICAATEAGLLPRHERRDDGVNRVADKI